MTERSEVQKAQPSATEWRVDHKGSRRVPE
jgi:hypothetical protein